MALWTGGKPTLRTYEMVCLYLQGWADEEELLAHLKKLKPTSRRLVLAPECRPVPRCAQLRTNCTRCRRRTDSSLPLPLVITRHTAQNTCCNRWAEQAWGHSTF